MRRHASLRWKGVFMYHHLTAHRLNEISRYRSPRGFALVHWAVRSGVKLRTFSVLSCWMGVVRDSWNQGILGAHPIRQSWGGYTEKPFLADSCPEDRHVVHLAENWQEALAAGLVGSSSAIGQRVGPSDGRVRQIVRLANLHSEIIAFLKSLRS